MLSRPSGTNSGVPDVVGRESMMAAGDSCFRGRPDLEVKGCRGGPRKHGTRPLLSRGPQLGDRHVERRYNAFDFAVHEFDVFFLTLLSIPRSPHFDDSSASLKCGQIACLLPQEVKPRLFPLLIAIASSTRENAVRQGVCSALCLGEEVIDVPRTIHLTQPTSTVGALFVEERP